jgi:hypothetical protein
MTTLTNSAEGGTNGTTATTANTGGTSGSAFDSVGIGSGASLIFDNTQAAHGGLSYKFATGATAADVNVKWDTSLGSSLTTVWFRLYGYFTAHPAAKTPICILRSGTANASQVSVLPSGKIAMSASASGTNVLTSTGTIPVNTWWRLEGFCTGNASTGQIEFKLFTTSPDAVTPDETQTSSATQNTTGLLSRADFGNSSGALANMGPYWQDDLGVSDAAYLGPAVTGQTVNLVTAQETIAAPVPSLSEQIALSAAGLSAGAPAPSLLEQLSLPVAQVAIGAQVPSPRVQVSLTTGRGTVSAPAPTSKLSLSPAVAQESVNARAFAPALILPLAAAHVTISAPAPTFTIPGASAALATARETIAALAPSQQIKLTLATAQAGIAAPASSPKLSLSLAAVQATITAYAVSVVTGGASPLGPGTGGTASWPVPGGGASSTTPGGIVAWPDPGGSATSPSAGGVVQ